MTLQQGLAFALVGATIIAFIWGRFRYDLVALVALVVGVGMGIIPAKSAFDGFRNDVTVIIACALVISAAFARSGFVELVLRKILPLLKSERSQVPVLTLCVTVLSMATKNVGALAIMLPIAQQVARRTGSAPSRLLMPMSFGAMIGGLVTLVGTAPNIIVSEVRQNLLGKPFAMFDYAPVGLVLTGLALTFLSFAYRLLPSNRAGAQALDAALTNKAYLTEVSIPEDWALGRLRIGEVLKLAEGEVQIIALLRKGRRRPSPHPNTLVGPGDILLLEGEQQALDAFVVRAKLTLTRND